MAWAFRADLGILELTPTSATSTFWLSNLPQTGDYLVVTVVKDNVSTSTGVTNEILSVVDGSNGTTTLQKFKEYTYSAGAADSGVTVAIFGGKITAADFDNLVITTTTTVAGMTAWCGAYSYGSGNTITLIADVESSYVNTTSPSQTISGLPSREYLFVRCAGVEGNSYAYNRDLNYNSQGTAVGNDVASCTEHAIITASGATITGSFVNNWDGANIFIAMKEAAPGYTITADTTTFDITTQSSTLSRTYKVVADTSAFTASFNDGNLGYNVSAPRSFTMITQAGSFGVKDTVQTNLNYAQINTSVSNVGLPFRAIYYQQPPSFIEPTHDRDIGSDLWYASQNPMETCWSATHGRVSPRVLTALSGDCTITIASPCVVTLPNHGFHNTQSIVFSTTGALPTGITAGTTYFVLNTTANPMTRDTFYISTTSNGSPLNTSGSQSGTHTVKHASMVYPSYAAHPKFAKSVKFASATPSPIEYPFFDCPQMPLTIMATFRPTSITGQSCLISFGNPGNNVTTSDNFNASGIGVMFQGGNNLEIEFAGSDQYMGFAQNLTANEDYVMVVVIRSGSTSQYIRSLGSQTSANSYMTQTSGGAAATIPSTITSTTDSLRGLMIGAMWANISGTVSYSSPSEMYHGPFAVWGRELSVTEIHAMLWNPWELWEIPVSRPQYSVFLKKYTLMADPGTFTCNGSCAALTMKTPARAVVIDVTSNKMRPIKDSEIGTGLKPVIFECGKFKQRSTPSAEKIVENLVVFSEQFDQTSWVKSDTTVSANATVAPDGTTTADKIMAVANGNSHYIRQAVSYAGPGTFSVYAKAAECSYISFATDDPTSYWTHFDLIGTGAFYIGTGWSNATITNVGNGWYRCTSTHLAPTWGNIYITIRKNQDTDGNTRTFFTGTGTDGLYLWGAQLMSNDLILPYARTDSAIQPFSTGVPVVSTLDNPGVIRLLRNHETLLI